MKKERMANLELLRCVAMGMVVVLHYLGKGGLLPELSGETIDSTGCTAWLLEAFCIVAVNVYMFISGYFLSTSSFKISRLLQLYLQVWFYSVAVGIIGALAGWTGDVPVDTHYFLTLLFPVSMGHYWFMTAYVYFYLLLPFLGIAVKKMSKRELGMSAMLLLTAFCFLKSVLPLRLEMDGQGYDCLWYLCVFVAAAYIRRFGLPFLEKKGRGLLLYLIGCLAIFGGTFMLRAVYLKTGSFGLMLKMCFEYNHLLPFLAAVGLFFAFSRLQISGKAAEVICRISPCTLGVYLLHENIGVRYAWQNWLGAGQIGSPLSLIGRTALAVLAVFTAGLLVDRVRALLFDGIWNLLKRLPLLQHFLQKQNEAE